MDLPGLFGIARYSCFESNDFIFDPMDYGGISLVCLDGNVSALIWESVTTRAASLLQLLSCSFCLYGSFYVTAVTPSQMKADKEAQTQQKVLAWFHLVAKSGFQIYDLISKYIFRNLIKV